MPPLSVAAVHSDHLGARHARYINNPLALRVRKCVCNLRRVVNTLAICLGIAAVIIALTVDHNKAGQSRIRPKRRSERSKSHRWWAIHVLIAVLVWRIAIDEKWSVKVAKRGRARVHG